SQTLDGGTHRRLRVGSRCCQAERWSAAGAGAKAPVSPAIQSLALQNLAIQRLPMRNLAMRSSATLVGLAARVSTAARVSLAARVSPAGQDVATSARPSARVSPAPRGAATVHSLPARSAGPI